MKLSRLALAISLSLPALAWSATYYVNANTTATTQNGAQATPFKTLAQLNSAAQASGSTVILKCGSTWYETLQVKAGVTYTSDSAGTCAKPIISGADDLRKVTWQLDSSDPSGMVYWADVSSLNLTSMGQLFYSNLLRMTRARHPNVGAGSYATGSRYDVLQPGTQSYGTVVPDLSKLTPAQQAAVSTEGWDGARLYHWFGGYMLQQLDLSTQNGAIVAGAPGPESTYQHLNYNHEPGTPYYLENRHWMLDSETEWFLDVKTDATGVHKRLYFWPVNGTSPQKLPYFAATRDYGISAINVGGFTIKNIEVRQTVNDAVHVENPGSAAFTISNLTIKQAGLRGIFVKGSVTGTISGNTIANSRSLGIQLGNQADPASAPASTVTVSGNTVTNAGEQLYAVAAIHLARGNTASNNTVQNVTGIGIFANRDTSVKNNTLTSTCMNASDCGAIYLVGRDDQPPVNLLGYPLNTTISGNRIDTVQPSAGEVGHANVGAHGIYLDDWATTASVTGNFVTNAGVGLMLHYTRNITVSNNFLVGNHVTQLRLMEANPTLSSIDCGGAEAQATGLACDGRNFMVSNTIQNNVMVAPEPTAKLVHQLTAYDSTDDFAKYSYNAYVGMSAAPFYDEAGSNAWLDSSHTRLNKGWSMTGWSAMQDHDQIGSRYFANLPAATAGTALPMPQFDNGFWGWGDVTSELVTSPGGVQGRHYMVADAARGNSGIFAIGTQFPVLKRGDSYRLSFDAKATSGALRVLLRESVPQVATDEVSFLLGGNQWQTYSRVITVTENTTAPGQLVFIFDTPDVSVANLRVVPLTQTVDADNVKVFDNFGGTANKTIQSCGAANGVCSNYVDAKTGLAVSFPLTLSAQSAKVLVRTSRTGADADLDGVADGQDSCASTAATITPNAAGCLALSN